MELVEGPTLRELIGTTGLELRAALDIAAQIADALDSAHLKGVVHRDIKPSNIAMIGRRHVKVLDFGLATVARGGGLDATATRAVTQSGSTVGTPHYMSPEACAGQPADARSDLWSLGVVLYQMLSGRPAVRRRDRDRGRIGDPPREPGAAARLGAAGASRSAGPAARKAAG
jgi:serine/threonine-protein kinase